MSKDAWRSVVGYKGLYSVSSSGEIKSLHRTVKRGNSFSTVRGRTLKQNRSGHRYMAVALHKGGKQKTHKTHVLVAEAFLDHTPCGKEVVVDHIDHNCLNNHLDNLQLISHRENLSRSKKGCSSKFTGVSKPKGRNKWEARIFRNGKNERIGNYSLEKEASEAYQKELKKLNNG